MAEQRKGKASEVVERLMSRPFSAREQARRTPKVPELQLRRDGPAIEIDRTTPVADALTQLQAEGIGTLTLRGPDGEPKAVVLSVERYLDLAVRELKDAPGVATNGRIMMTDAALRASHVEQVDPTEPWRTLPTQLA